jgi:excinuclease UvrABC nuclease subunit
VRKEIRAGIEAEAISRAKAFEAVGQGRESQRRQAELIEQLETDMMQAAAELDFECAARIRDEIAQLKDGNGRKRISKKTRRSNRSRGGRIPRPKQT